MFKLRPDRPFAIYTGVALTILWASSTDLTAQTSKPPIYELTPVDQEEPLPIFPSTPGNSRTMLQRGGYFSVPPASSQAGLVFVSPTAAEAVEESGKTDSGSAAATSQVETLSPPSEAAPGASTSTPFTFRNPQNTVTIPASPPAVPETDAARVDSATPIQASPPAVAAPVLQTVAESDPGSLKTVAASLPLSQTDLPARLSPGIIEERQKQVESGDLPDDVKAAVMAQYQQATEMLRRADEATRKAAELKAEKEKGPEVIADIRRQLAQAPERSEPQVPAEASISELEQLRLADEERLTDARKALESWEQRAKVRSERKPQMPALIDKTKQQLADVRKSMELPSPEGENPAVSQARRTEQEAFVLLIEAQLDLYQVEKSRYEALNELFPLQRDLSQRSRNIYEKRAEAWKAVLLEAGRRETERQAAEARRNLQNAHPALRELAERNAELTQLRTGLQDLLETTRNRLDAIKKKLENLESDFKSVKDKEERAGLTTAVGILLRNQRNHLPAEAPYREDRRKAESEMSRLQLEQMPLEDERDDLSDPALLAEEIVAGISQSAQRSEIDITEMTLSLLNDRKKYLGDVLTDYDACIKELAELDVRSRKLVETTTEYRNYIDERVLWIRSAGLVGVETPQKALSGLGDIARPELWYQTGLALSGDILRMPLLTSLFGCGLLFLLALRSRLRKWISLLGDPAQSQSAAGVLPTLGALLLTLVVASVWPLVLWLIGKRLSTGLGGEFGVAVGESLITTTIVFWSVEILRQICAGGGIAIRHLKWPAASVSSLHNSLLTLMMFGLPLAFGVCLSERWQDGIWSDSLGRILFVAGMLLLAVSIRRIVRPDGRVLANVLRRHQNGWLCRSRRVWYPAAVLVPLVLAGMAIAGYQFTAQQLLIRVELTFWLLIGLLIAFSLTMRWLTMARRVLALEQARLRRTAEMTDAGEDALQMSSSSPLLKVEEPKIDFSLLSEQMRKLVRIAACVLFLSGGWFIWGEVVPALQVFNRVDLWHTTVQVAEEFELTEGQTETRMVTRTQAITLGSLLLAISFLVVSAVASRNIPGLLELSVLQRLPMDHGGRNAITTICRYALTLTGVLMAAQTIGIGWSSVQWLLAALTVGLGFGLQEIFANFVSGLIILFERPVRIGDVVTIDGVSGSVSRIQIRATTITDFDRKEYIVPNKEFVTGRVLNWTLSDKTNRIVITVGVAYGSNTELARSLLVKAASDHPLVLEDPAPVATFEGFGDSCLTLLLRCFLPSLENRLKTITELHEAIDREFKGSGLEIAFPQRDIHVRSFTSFPAVAAATEAVPETSSAEARKAA